MILFQTPSTSRDSATIEQTCLGTPEGVLLSLFSKCIFADLKLHFDAFKLYQKISLYQKPEAMIHPYSTAC